MLEIKTLGGLQVVIDGASLGNLVSRKGQALLVYLAFSEHSRSREVLADLFWEGHSQTRAMNNLRVALSNLRKHLSENIIIERNYVALNRDSDYWLDVSDFQSEISNGNAENAIRLYRGDFLEGFHLRGCIEYDHWLITEQEILRQKMISTLQRKVRRCIASGRYLSGQTFARRLLEMNPVLESAHRKLMRMLVYEDQREAALAHFKTCQKILSDELGVEPSIETIELYDQIQNGKLALPKLPVAPPHNLPSQPTPFIGRKDEIRRLRKLIRNSGVRTISVVGSGGMGKTRLVQEASMREITKFAHGVCFVSLAGLKDPDEVVPAIANELKFTFRVEGEPYKQLIDYLRNKDMLLILDNIEHLLDNIEIIKRIVNSAVNVKLLITSRVKPDAPGEHIIHLEGMDIPDNESSDTTNKFSSVELFLSAANRINAEFELSSSNQKDVLEICRLVEGMPLGLILAASWVQILEPSEIVSEIRSGIDFLETDAQEHSIRHQSLRAVFDNSWLLLAKSEQEILQKISVFRGGFSSRAAQEITGASLFDLKLLADKTFIQHVDRGRYQVHELTRQYLFEKLVTSPVMEHETRNHHSNYFIQGLKQWNKDSKGANQVRALEKVRVNIDNARHAWDWAVEHSRVDQIAEGLDGICIYFFWLALFQEGAQLCQITAERLLTSNSVNNFLVASRALTWQSKFNEYMSKYQLAIRLAIQSFELLENSILENKEILSEKAFSMAWMGAIGRGVEEIEAKGVPIKLIEESILIYRAAKKDNELAEALQYLGNLLQADTNYDDANNAFEKSISIYRRLDDYRGTAETLTALSNLNRVRGNLENAENYAIESVAQFRELENHLLIADALQNLGWNKTWAGNFNEGIIVIEESLSIFKNLGMQNQTAFLIATLAFIYVELGKYQEARAQIESILNDPKANEFYYYHLGQATIGLSMYPDGEYAEAKPFLTKSLLWCEEMGLPLDRGLVLGLLGILDVETGKMEKGRKRILESLQIGREIGAFYILIHAIPAAARFLSSQGEIELAVEIYEFAKQYSFVSNSQWFADAIEQKINDISAELPKGVVEDAKKQGMAREQESTIVELIDKLGN